MGRTSEQARGRQASAFDRLPPEVRAELQDRLPGLRIRLARSLQERTLELGALSVILETTDTFFAELERVMGPRVGNWPETRQMLEGEIRRRAASMSPRQKSRTRSDSAGLPYYLRSFDLDEIIRLPTGNSVKSLSPIAKLWLMNLAVLGARDIYVPLPSTPWETLPEDVRQLMAGGASKRDALVRWCREHLPKTQSPRTISEAQAMIAQTFHRHPSTVRRRLAGIQQHAKTRIGSHARRYGLRAVSSGHEIRRKPRIMEARR